VTNYREPAIYAKPLFFLQYVMWQRHFLPQPNWKCTQTTTMLWIVCDCDLWWDWL